MAGLSEHRLVGVLYKLPSNYEHIMNMAVDVPAAVSEAFGLRGLVPVVGTADGTELTATLVPVGGGCHRLLLNAPVRNSIGKGAGDQVTIQIRLNPEDRTPADLQESLTGSGAWPPGRRSRLRDA
ncbi:MAG: DUF1905 domain-containing protein [Acidimicrobiaceae bacterium]|nr:DUF1905 domain-containing protein [Acidimicrobiaceae bacterium]